MKLFTKSARTGGSAFCAAVAIFSIVAGCGGGSDSPLPTASPSATRTVPVRFAINWEDNTTVPGPAVRHSVIVTLRNATESGDDFVVRTEYADPVIWYSIDPDPDKPFAHTQNITSTNRAKVGPSRLQVQFYDQCCAGGTVTRVTESDVTIAEDGTGIGEINTAVVPPD
ncbi:MAG: hypothetical protein H8F28_18130 [Fibrella sp.]|nr:hypothetical protein [Armatimonadota bacterium]